MVTLLTVCFTFCSYRGVTSSSCSSLSDTVVPPHRKCMTFQLLDEQLKAGSVLSVDTHKNLILNSAKRFDFYLLNLNVRSNGKKIIWDQCDPIYRTLPPPKV